MGFHGLLLTLKLAGYFATHIQARGEGFVEPPKIFETANNLHMRFGMQLEHELLINLPGNNHH